VLSLYHRFAPAAWGHGYAGEMVRAALDLAARLDGGEPVVAVIRDTNAPSLRVAERAGLVCAGTIDHGGVPSRLYRLPAKATLT
jgi:RimJ/RimL family protein N-acetyltransferase